MPRLDTALLTKATLEGLEPHAQGQADGALRAYLTGLCESIGYAWDRWQAQAILVDVRIEGSRASGGRVSGTDIEGLIRARGPEAHGEHTLPIAIALRDQLRRFERELSVPNLVWYPRFAHVEAASAGNVMNLPCPLRMLAGKAAVHLSGERIESAIVEQRRKVGIDPDSLGTFGKPLQRALAAGFDATIPPWLDQTMVTQVIGEGPVPGYAPPEVAGAPVVGGIGAMPRGGGFY